MNLIIKRRQLILGTLVVALGAAVFVNWYYTNNGKDKIADTKGESEYVQNLGEAQYVNAQAAQEDYVSEIKLNREKSRDEALDKLNKSLKNASSGSEEAKTITKSINALTKEIKLENDLETLISTKISGMCIAVVNGDSVQIVVEKGKLNESTALQITDIVTTNGGTAAENIKITETA
ncbi:MAG: SpoIIIAH-like family protein [Clostridia bacterium]|nr:SpoIIIAH-like family protein [Clostridia bacterium]